ncbi:hypothetical protein H5410_022582 [Solanum commersonii]|uniref:Disease resistance protein winged helix domain-containing protein n=1 Tax=Solanum commersonii TaxID=4109 RepID=A0A9J5ZFV3_SOLCO|nr:hypothetical protein H5410_022582 [Solanum commersonii]
MAKGKRKKRVKNKSSKIKNEEVELIASKLDDFEKLRMENVAMMTEEIMFEYRDNLLKHLPDLPKYCANLLLPLMSDYKILRQVYGHLRDFYSILVANKTNYYYKEYEVSQCYSKINSLLINIIPLELEVLYICTSKIMKESRSTELEEFVKKILKTSPRILQNYLILIQECMAGAVAAHVGGLTRKISILVGKLLEESSENNIKEAEESFKEIGMVIESLEFLRSSFGKVRQMLYDTSGAIKDCWMRALDVAYEAEHIKLIVAEVTSLQLEDKNGDVPLDAESSDKPIKSTSSFFVEVTVGHEEYEAWIIDQLLDEHESKLDVISISQPHHMDSVISANNNLQMIKVSKLMQLWIAEGFVDHYIPSKSNLEEITQSYLDALISSSMVMVDRSVSKSSRPFFVAIKVLEVSDLCKLSPAVVVEPPESGNSMDPKQAFHHGTTAQNNQTVKAETCTTDALGKFPNLQHFDCNILVLNDPPTNDNWFPKLFMIY